MQSDNKGDSLTDNLNGECLGGSCLASKRKNTPFEGDNLSAVRRPGKTSVRS